MDFNDVDYSTFEFDSCDFSDFTHGLYVRSSNYCEFDLNEIEAHDNTSHALYFTGITYSDFDMSGLRCSHNGSGEFKSTGRTTVQTCGTASCTTTKTLDSRSNGTNNTEKDSLNVTNSGFSGTMDTAFERCQGIFEHLTILDNTSHGLYLDGSFYGMSQLLSSTILWGNGANPAGTRCTSRTTS